MIPEHLKEGIDAWVESGRPTGSFLRAVLENDLLEAVNRADEISFANLRYIVGYLWSKCPCECWGSKKAVKEWRERKERERFEKDQPKLPIEVKD